MLRPRELRQLMADKLVGGSDAVLVIDKCKRSFLSFSRETASETLSAMKIGAIGSF
jgi:hypothetical protein